MRGFGPNPRYRQGRCRHLDVHPTRPDYEVFRCNDCGREMYVRELFNDLQKMIDDLAHSNFVNSPDNGLKKENETLLEIIKALTVVE